MYLLISKEKSKNLDTQIIIIFYLVKSSMLLFIFQ